MRPIRSFLVLALACAGVASAQTPPVAPQARPPLGASIAVDALGGLPSNANLFPLLDTLIPEIITDRIDTGGVSTGAAARVGARGSTWTQTLFRIGDVEITDPSGTGAPLMIPGVEQWERVDVTTGMMPIDVSAPGVAVSLVPRLPASSWMRTFQFLAAPPALTAGEVAAPPATITRLSSWVNSDFFLSGPLVRDRLAMLASVTWTRAARFERDGQDSIDATLSSAFLNFVSTPTKADQVRLTGWMQRARDAAPHRVEFGQPGAGQRNNGLHLQTAWRRMLPDAKTGVRAFGGVTGGTRTTDLRAPRAIIVDSVTAAPIPNLLHPDTGTERTWSLGARLDRPFATASGKWHTLLAGIDLSRGSSNARPFFDGRVGELVNGIPARVWDFTVPATESSRRSSMFTMFVGDTAAISSKVTINGGLRFEAVGGSSDAGATPVSWRNLLPRAGVRWAMLDTWDVSTFFQYGQYGHRLPLGDLAYGDPTAPTAAMYRWDAATTELPPTGVVGPLVQRWGPGTGGNVSFSSIDPALKRPVMHEAAIGFDAHPRPWAFVRLSGIARRENDLVGVVNIGAPASSYSVIGVPDPGVDIVGSQDDQILLFYNRSPETYGADRYLLTNPEDTETVFLGTEIVGQARVRNTLFIGGFTAGRSDAMAANRGFKAIENDAGLLGDVFINPNSRTNAKGRVFTERGYTFKVAGSRSFARDITFGMIARYQDGQHFARLVVLEGLNQGAEYVRAFPNGKTRFTFSMTVDARLQKSFTIGTYRLVALIDAYNLFNQSLQIEEHAVSGPASRQTSAGQPPRVVQIGARVAF